MGRTNGRSTVDVARQSPSPLCRKGGWPACRCRMRIVVDRCLFGLERLPVIRRVALWSAFPTLQTLPSCPTDAVPRLGTEKGRNPRTGSPIFISPSLRLSLKSVQRRIDGADHGLGLPRTLHQAFPLVEQGGLPVKARVIQRSPDFFERKTEFPADEDLLQPKQVSVGVKAVPGRCPGLGAREARWNRSGAARGRKPRRVEPVLDLIRARSSHEMSVQPDATRGSRGISWRLVDGAPGLPRRRVDGGRGRRVVGLVQSVDAVHPASSEESHARPDGR